MRKIKTIIILAFLLTFGTKTNASHVHGGQIRWECLSSGRYVFYMEVYINCAQGAASWNYQNTSLRVIGSPLPRGSNNSFVSSIAMQPDSVKWLNHNMGDITPQCDTNGTNSTSCGDPATTRSYYYKSSPITLRGVPPTNGWNFILDPPCCRPNVENLVNPSSNNMDLRAIMYPTANNDNVDPCIDTSPEFIEQPYSLICRGDTFVYNHSAIDPDLDSIIYAWDRTYNTYPTQPATYRTPQYDYNNPTPDESFNVKNMGAKLDPITGTMKMAVYNGTGNRSFLTVVRADAYRDGARIASIFREMPLYFVDCPKIAPTAEDTVSRANNAPDIYIDGVKRDDTTLHFVAGQKIRIPFQAVDFDYSAKNISGLQTVTVVPNGFMFSTDLRNQNSCITVPNRIIAPCAYLQQMDPVLNTNVDPPRREISDLGGIATEFVWETNCYHIRTAGTGVPGQQRTTYNFIMKTFDDHCPLPATVYSTISIKLRDPLPLTQPIMKGASIGLDGRLTYSWAPPIDSAFTFNQYAAETSAPNDNSQPAFWNTVRPNVNNYLQQRYEPGYLAFFNGGGQPNILQKRPGIDWYVRMTTESGCSANVASTPSEPVRVMELESTPAGQAPSPPRSRVRLDWNRPKPVNATTYPYYVYESPTHFYIWENDSIDVGGQYIGGEADPANWYLRGDTSATTYFLNTNTCNGRVGFRIEARDTVIVWEQGAGMRPGDETDTLTFSTFSIIDTMHMVDRGFIPAPHFDTIMVKENGDVYFRIDRANAGTAGRFKIYEDGNATPLANFAVPRDSFQYNGLNGNNVIGNFEVEAIDGCNPSLITNSNVYSTILLDGELLEPTCSLDYELRWNRPNGFPNQIRRYEIYIDSANTGFNLLRNINNANTTSATFKVNKGVNYRFRVIAVDQQNSVNISAVLNYTPPTNLRSFEIVPAPELLCTNIDSSGQVLLTFSPPKDTTNNGVAYEFEYRIVDQINGNWQSFSGSSQVDYNVDQQVFFTGINAYQNDYEFRARTISGCDANISSAFGESIKSNGIEIADQFLDYLYIEGKEAVSYQWYNCRTNIIIPFQNKKQFVPRDTGYYGVYVEYENCNDTTFCYLVDHVLNTKAAQLNYNTVESAEENAYYQWYDCREDTLIPGANSRRYIAADTGYYAVILTAYGYKDTSECIPMFSVGLDELNFENQLNVYPNPSSGLVNIEFSQNQQSLQVKVRNIHGQLVQEEQFVNQSNLQLQLNGKPGIYFIELVNAKGERANVKVLKR